MSAPSRRAVLSAGLTGGLGVGGLVLSGCSAAAPDSRTQPPTQPSTQPPTQPPTQHAGAPAVAHLVHAAPPAAASVALLRLPREGAAAAVRACAALAARRTGGGEAVALGLAHSAFDVLGLVARRPPGLVPMPGFTGDVLAPGRSGADLFLQAEAGDAATAAALLAEAAEPLRAAGAQVGWQTPGYREDAGTVGGRSLVRNPFGFVEGQSNPAPPQVAEVAVLDASDAVPAWALGGSYLALRVVRLARQIWDADSLARQRQIIGRDEDGPWLDGSHALADPPYAADPQGRVTALDAHVRLANPGTARAPRLRLVRRPFAYPAADVAAQEESGLLFMAFTRRLADFETIQTRLAGEPLSHYTLTVGGGYFVVPRLDPSWADELLGT